MHRVLPMAVALLAAGGMLVGCPKDEPVENNAPIADAGSDFTVPWGQTVVLSGSCTDDDPGDQTALTYAWTLESSPAASAITPANPEAITGRSAPDAFFDPDAPGAYVFSFQCTDPQGAASALATVTATVEEPPPNRDPTVDAGADTAIELGDTATLLASGSDPDGDTLAYAWTLETQPAGSALTAADLAGAATAEASITPDVSGDWVFAVAVDDGRGGTASDQVTLTVNEVVNLAGELTVTVVDAVTLAPLAGAVVAVDDVQLGGVTDASGVLTHTDAGLTGPVDVTVAPAGSVTWDHDGDPATAEVTAPRYRMTTLTGVDRPAVTIPVQPTTAGQRAAGQGTVTAAVPQSLFDTLPTIDRFFSIAGARISGQLRLVLVAPLLPRGSLTELEPGDFLSPSPAPAVPLPGNMATDDPFLNENANLFERQPGPGGEPAFTLMGLSAPSGTQRLYVLGGIATVDMQRLLPLLVSGAGVGSFNGELGIVLGAIDLTTLFSGIITVEVPDGGTVDISAALGNTAGWDAYHPVVHTTARENEQICDDAGSCLDLERLRIFPATAVAATAGTLPADARLASEVPATSPWEVFCGNPASPSHCDPVTLIDLDVPGTTRTGVPYGVNVAVLDIPAGHALAPDGGLALVGYQFARAPGLDRARTQFAVPALEGTFSGLSYSVSAVATRRISARDTDGVFYYQPGGSVVTATRLSPGADVSLHSSGAFDGLPSLSEASAGLDVEVLFEVEDSTVDPPTITGSQAMIRGAADASGGPDLPATLTYAGPAGASLVGLTLSEVDRVTTADGVVSIVQPRWDVYYPGDATSLGLPTLPAGLTAVGSGAETWVEAASFRFQGPFSYQQPDPRTFAQRRRTVSKDSWSFRMP